jgi:hypothetical protein
MTRAGSKKGLAPGKDSLSPMADQLAIPIWKTITIFMVLTSSGIAIPLDA